MTLLPRPAPGRAAAERFVAEHLGHLTGDPVHGSPAFNGGQTAADAALAAFDVAGYAGRRNEVWPPSRRGASRLSPYIRHGLLTLHEVWQHVAGGPARDMRKFRNELMWQEYARHWYATLGTDTRENQRHHLPESDDHGGHGPDDGWPRQLACLDLVRTELERDGWLVNQTRMWLAGHWTNRERLRWNDGEDYFFRHLLDGSRAANRLGWQWVTAAGSAKPYGFSRWQVERRAPGVCVSCDLRDACPIEHWPIEPMLDPACGTAGRTASRAAIAGPATVDRRSEPDVVWLTAESIGARDPALANHPDLPAVFVFDEPLLASLRLSSRRLVFLVETLAELDGDRDVELRLGDPVDEVGDRAVAATFAPVPGFRRMADRMRVAELHPWPWLRVPTFGSVSSFTAWRRGLGQAGQDNAERTATAPG